MTRAEEIARAVAEPPSPGQQVLWGGCAVQIRTALWVLGPRLRESP
jgi:hypothetical protein